MTNIQKTMPPRILLLGATGFIGGYVLRALLQAGFAVVAVRRKNKPRSNAPHQAEQSGQLTWLALQAHQLLKKEQWMPHTQGISVVINCIGILRQRLGERYEDVHHRLPAALAQACCDQSIAFIHTSALGLHANAKSRFLSSKLRGEQAIAQSGANFCIVRPSLIDGVGGFGASWLRILAASKIHVIPTAATGKIAAVQATDLGDAYACLAQQAIEPGADLQREANLGGERHFAYAEYLQLLRGVESEGISSAWQLPLPALLGRLGAHLCDLLRFSPFSYGHWILLQRDNLPIPNHLPALLGRAPSAVTYRAMKWCDDFRMS